MTKAQTNVVKRVSEKSEKTKIVTSNKLEISSILPFRNLAKLIKIRKWTHKDVPSNYVYF